MEMGTLPLHFKAGKRYTVFEKGFKHFREGREGPGLRRGGSIVIFLQIGKGQTSFILNLFGKEKLLHVASILPVKINLNYLQVSKNLYIKKISSPN